MEELILKLAVEAPHGFPWSRALAHQNMTVRKR